ncbi:MAG: iron ABC transporter permease [Clostridia bacterium]|nr:iron ABC transporter permease [Clostridia bacterium]MBQ2110164.1 iron ABC transporter permease [Clostridia bacterium]
MRRGIGRFSLVICLLFALLIIALAVNLAVGSVRLSPNELLDLLKNGRNASTESLIVFNIRMPRMLLAAILGGALAVSGFLLQSFFRNPIAGPFVLGISSGAKMIVGITMIFLAGSISLSPAVLVCAAFVGSLLITAVVLLFSQKVRNMELLLVVGIMVGYICSAVTDMAVTFASEQDIVNLKYWSMGTFSGKGWESVVTAALICAPALIAAWLLSKPMGAYALGEGYAKSMGVAVKPFRLALILLSSLLSACVTALAGPISFVGIAVPHITRTLLKSSKPALVIPAAFLAGAVFCLFCDLIARTVFSPTELNIGTVTSIFGAPVVILMMVNRRRRAGQ